MTGRLVLAAGARSRGQEPKCDRFALAYGEIRYSEGECVVRSMLVGLVLAILVAVFAVQNAHAVTIQAYFWTLPQVSLVLVILLSALVGVVLGALFGASQMWRMRASHRQELKQLKAERDLAVGAHQAALKETEGASKSEEGAQPPPDSPQ